jgi:rubrerythrin
MSERELVEVYRAKDSPQAHMLRSALEDAGIAAVIEGDLPHTLGEVDMIWSGAPRVMVARHDVARAREIITHAERASAAAATNSPEGEETDVCLACGTRMTDEDEKCPACGWSYKKD